MGVEVGVQKAKTTVSIKQSINHNHHNEPLARDDNGRGNSCADHADADVSPATAVTEKAVYNKAGQLSILLCGNQNIRGVFKRSWERHTALCSASQPRCQRIVPSVLGCRVLSLPQHTVTRSNDNGRKRRAVVFIGTH